MELGETKSLGVLNDHDRGIRHIDTDFNYGCCHHDLCFVFHKTLHLKILIFHGHLAVNNTDLVLRQGKFALQIFQSGF
ncbi:hypothetical protein D3C85_1296250 [compost metagenome]